MQLCMNTHVRSLSMSTQQYSGNRLIEALTFERNHAQAIVFWKRDPTGYSKETIQRCLKSYPLKMKFQCIHHGWTIIYFDKRFFHEQNSYSPVSCIDKQAEKNSKYRRIVALSYNSRYRNRSCPSSNGEAYNSKYLYHEYFFLHREA